MSIVRPLIMKAAVMESGAAKPVFKDIQFEERGGVKVKVLGTAIHHLVRGRATGTHYSVKAGDTADRLIGVDGVGIAEGNQLCYFIAFGPGEGSFAEYANVDKNLIFPFPYEIGLDDQAAIARVATLANPAMSSFLALGSRLKSMVKPGFTVAINGVTGASGGIASEISRKVFGAKHVIGVGRSLEKLENRKKEYKLDDIVVLSDPNEKSVETLSKYDVDVVLDYTWGEAAQKTLELLVRSRKDSSKQLCWVQIGQIGGADFTISPSILRSQNIFVLGSGIGSFPKADAKPIFQQLTNLLANGTIGSQISIESANISDIETEWDLWKPDSRKVFKF